jgi:hypothetical protein
MAERLEGRPLIEFDPGPHTYVVNGDAGFPSVTTVIHATVAKPFGVAAWYGYKMGVAAGHRVAQIKNAEKMPEDEFYAFAKDVENPNRVLDKAGARGTAIHDALEQYAKTGNIPVPADFPEEDQARVIGVVKWLEENRPVFIGSEVRTCSLEHRYVGTLDAFVKFEAGEHVGKLARIDFKTSKRVYPDEHFCQIEAYEQAEVELGELPADFRGILHIPASGRCKLHLSTFSFEDFRVLLQVYDRLQGRKKK